MAYRVLFPVCDTSRYDAVCEIHDLVTDWKEYRDADSRFYWLPFQKEKELSRDELIKSSLLPAARLTTELLSTADHVIGYDGHRTLVSFTAGTSSQAPIPTLGRIV